MAARATAWLAVALVGVGAACGGRAVGPAGAGAAGSAAAGATGAAGLGGAGGMGGAGAANDPGFVGWRLLTNREYDNTIRDLLGVRSTARQTFPSDEPWAAFDSRVFLTHYEQYFDEADRVATAVFADPALRGPITACPSAAPGTEACLSVAIASLAQRAWRRPISSAETESLNALARTALAQGHPFDEALRRVLTGLLSSAPFLHRIELDPDRTSLAPHSLTPWELASRLSYLAWSTMPDAQLFALAADGSLAREDVLAAELERLLADARANELIDAFALGWLLGGSDAVRQHQVEPALAPTWTPELAAAMTDEARLYVAEFLHGDRNLATFPEADLNFVNADLARHYDFPTAGLGTDLRRVEVTTDRRRGFLGQGAFLTVTSFSYRTSPSVRGARVLELMLCEEIPDPPAEVPKLTDTAPVDPALNSQGLRARLEAHDKDKSCSPCHQFLDPVGLGFEEFDETGRFRKVYKDGMAIDVSGALFESTKVGPNGELPPSKKFNGEAELASLIARDPRFLDCASRKALSYALGKPLGNADAPNLTRIRAAWVKQGTTLRALIKRIVLDDTFRTRRAEGTP